jgi:hypothetical protein
MIKTVPIPTSVAEQKYFIFGSCSVFYEVVGSGCGHSWR